MLKRKPLAHGTIKHRMQHAWRILTEDEKNTFHNEFVEIAHKLALTDKEYEKYYNRYLKQQYIGMGLFIN